jgi:hypothetical protein
MTIFAVLMPVHQPGVVAEIHRLYPNDHLPLNDSQFLISTSSTAVDLAAKLGIVDPQNPQKPSTGNAVVLATSSYFGRAPATVWDWMKTKLESPASA